MNTRHSPAVGEFHPPCTLSSVYHALIQLNARVSRCIVLHYFIALNSFAKGACHYNGEPVFSTMDHPIHPIKLYKSYKWYNYLIFTTSQISIQHPVPRSLIFPCPQKAQLPSIPIATPSHLFSSHHFTSLNPPFFQLSATDLPTKASLLIPFLPSLHSLIPPINSL